MGRQWFKEDGTLDTVALDALEANLQAITSQTGRLMDKALGKGLIPAFQCGHSLLLYPANYVKRWGHEYGIGLGPDVCSEALDSDYDCEPPEVTKSIKRITQIMHPMRATRAQMDLVFVTPEAFDARPTVLASEDPDYEMRAPILLEHQLGKSGALKALYADWERRNGPVTLSQGRMVRA